MTYDQWKATDPSQESDWPEDDKEFCLIHGFDHMKQDFGNPIPYCAECDRQAKERGE